jgi:hypothetical protein
MTEHRLLNNILGSEYWVNSGKIDFYEIQSASNVPHKWTKSEAVLKSKYKNKIIKPINAYAINFGIKPELIIKNDFIILRQSTHADIWVEEKRKKRLYALDKTWMRQFYPSDQVLEEHEDCYIAQYKLYTPWIIDADVSVDILEIAESPFFIYPNTLNFNKINMNLPHIYPKWVYFLIKKQDSMEKEGFFVIKNNTPVFDIIVKDKKIIEKIIKEYNEK